ncbi:MAG: amino acid permease [Gammaproteobacteria bacterium]|jgi:basic amino acid/polyamine antiporter, APA family|nr:amino acid permease [Gammaproteobacteria bacterium]MBT4492688.1 amino acid permease [Gammaproteobacteria bacterium]MBT7371162.1 amino acid permease [Gammaproteobacteria bacterium]
MSSQKYSVRTAIAIVVANMIGTGVFTSLGFQLMDIQSTFVLLMLWLVGGVTALCGALTYAELGSSLPRSGGEYNFLSEIYHPAAGFVSGWISATVGFAAPTALAAMTFGAYLEASVEGISATLMASVLVVALTFTHVFSHAASGGVQTIFTLLKVVLVLLFVVTVGWSVQEPQVVRLLPDRDDGILLTSSAFAVSLIYVNYAFTGWNAATYIINEVDEPQRNMPVILFTGTVVVIILYLMLNYIFLYAAPMSAMAGKIEIGVIVAQHAFGETGAMVMGFILATLLVSTVSAMVIAGPRVLQVIGEDFRLFSVLSQTNRDGIPMVAIFVQSGVTLFFILTSTFESVLVFSGFVMGINTFFAVAGVFILRRRQTSAGTYKTWGYPVTPLVFLGLMAWTLTYILLNRPEEGWAGLAVIAVGAAVYFVTERFNQPSAR